MIIHWKYGCLYTLKCHEGILHLLIPAKTNILLIVSVLFDDKALFICFPEMIWF